MHRDGSLLYRGRVMVPQPFEVAEWKWEHITMDFCDGL